MHEVNFSHVDLNLLKLFDALIKERSVTRAGQKLGLSQPAASRGLGRLRRMLGDKLVIPTAKGLELTPRAAFLSEPVAKLLEEAKQIVAPSIFSPSETTGRISIAANDHMSLLLMPKLLSKLATLAPNLDLEIAAPSGDNVKLVAQGEVDLAIGVYDKLPARFHQRSLYNEDFVCLVRRDHPVLSKHWDLECFIALSHISVIITGHGKNVVDEALAKLNLSRRIAVRLPHFLAAPMLVAESDMILSLPRRLANRIATSMPVEVLELPLEIERFSPSIIWNEKRHDDPAHIWLRNLIMEVSSEVN